jgi:tetratricopeptide (TPR) repeat protein
VLGSLLDCSPDAEAEQVRAQIEALGPTALDATDQQVLTDLTLAGEVEGMAQDTVELAIATAVRRLLKVTASREPTAILIDDARQLPDRERVLLAAAAAATRDTALLVVVADRKTALHTWPHQQYRRIEIGPLDADEAERLLRKLAGGRTVRAETIPVILDYSGGNPLYLVETVHLLDAQGDLTTQSPRERGAPSIKVPGGIKPLVLARFDALEPPAKRALIYAAVIGRSFTLGLLSRLAGDARILSVTLEALGDKGLLEHESAGKGPVRMRFSHELVREVLYDLTTRKTRATIHDEVANLLLAKTGGEALPEEIAHHLELAGRDAEAADLFEKAGNDRARRQQSAESAAYYRSAVAALERAQAVGMTRGGDASGREVTLRIKLARALNGSSQWDEAGRVALIARNAAQQAGDIASTARASRQLARAASEQGKLSEAYSLLREAHDAALECGDLTLSADLASDLGEVQERTGDLEKAMKTLLGALDTLETATSRSRFTQTTAASSKVAEVLNRLGRVALRAGMDDKATRYLEGALEQARTAGDQGLAARILGNLGQARAMAGDLDLAFETLEEALEAAQGLGDRLGVAKLLYNQARLHLGAGRCAQAEALARESFDLSVEIGWREGEAMGAAFLEQVTARRTV